MAILRTQGVVLRRMNRRDRRFFASLYTNEEIMRYIGSPMTVEAARLGANQAVLAGAKPNAKHRYWIIEVGRKRLRCGLAGWIYMGTTVELGIILSRAWHGRGIAAASLTALVSHAASVLKARTFVVRHRVDHAATAALVKSLGFVLQEDDDHQTCTWLLQL